MAGARGCIAVGEIEGAPAAAPALRRAGSRQSGSGEAAVLEQLLAPHERPLFALCHGILGHADDAEDAVQEAFLRALRGLSTFRGEAAFRTWLYRIAVNVCLEGKRRQRPTEPWEEDRFFSSPAASPEAIALRRLQIREALASLPRRHRAILQLKEREGWSLAEIAAVMRCSKKRVERELSKARLALAAWRERQERETG
jgi:RNA polymerase sigma-70 factor (ECF subfamily)